MGGICGEMGVLDPAKDQALGTVYADTMVETLALHSTVFQTFDVTPALLERIRRKSRIVYPDDEHIMRRLKAIDDEKAVTKKVVSETAPPPKTAPGKRRTGRGNLP